MKPRINKKWYLEVSLFMWKRKLYTVHRLVWSAFLWLDLYEIKKSHWICVLHKDDNPSNNNVNNLFLWTHLDNVKDMDKKWRRKNWLQWKFWKDSKSSKKVAQYTVNWELIKIWDCIKDITRELWFDNSWITKCCKGAYKTCNNFIWKYI